MAGEPLYGLTTSDRTRVQSAVDDFENRRRNPPPDGATQYGDVPSAIMRMTTPISWGETGLALMMRADRQDDGSIQWNPVSDSQYQVALASGNRNRIDKGCYVHCVLTAAGWVVVNSWVMGYIGSTMDPVPFGCYAVRHNGGDGTSFPGHLNLYPIPDDDDLNPWEYDYAFGTEIDESLGNIERSPLGEVIKGLGQQGFADDGVQRLYPLQTSLPAWVAYDQDADADLPDDVLEALGWETAAHPNAGERWGPVRGGVNKIKRTAQVLALYWWEWLIPAATEVQKVTLTNAPASHNWYYVLDGVQSGSIVVTEAASGVQSTLEAMSNIGVGNVVVTGSLGGPYTITFQGALANTSVSQGQFVAASGSSAAGYVETLTDGAAELRRQFISPNGWWGDWGWNGWGWGGIYPYWSWWFSGVSPSYYGNWGLGWWHGRWGGLPPASTDIVYTGTDPPTPPEGTITRYCVHSYIVWQHGWKVLSVDQDKEIAFIIGDLKFERSQVIVNADITDCPTYDGPGANPGT